MENTKSHHGILSFALGVFVALLIVGAGHIMFEPAYAQKPPKIGGGGGGGGGELHALGSGCWNAPGEGILWIYDPETKQLAAYANEFGRHIKFIGARKVTYDLKLRAVNDKSKMKVEDLEREWKKMNEKKGK